MAACRLGITTDRLLTFTRISASTFSMAEAGVDSGTAAHRRAVPFPVAADQPLVVEAPPEAEEAEVADTRDAD